MEHTEKKIYPIGSSEPITFRGAPLPVIEYDYEVKSWPWFFEEMIAGRKKHDMRDKRDRAYAVGDRMLLREFDPRTGQYTGRAAIAKISYITDNVTPCAMSSSALDNSYAILSVEVEKPRLYMGSLSQTPAPGY